MSRFRVGGAVVESDWGFAAPLVPAEGPADVVFEVSEAPFHPGFVGSGPTRWMVAGRVDGAEVIRFPSVGDVWVEPHRIRLRLAVPDAAFRVEQVFFAFLFPWWLAARGWQALHGSAVCRDGQVVAFVGPNGAGKTSAALELADRGWMLVSDDLLVVDPELRVHPTFPEVRLRPRHAAARFGAAHGLSVAHPATDKLRAPAPSFSADPAPLSKVVLLVGPTGGVPVRPGGAETLLHLMFNSVPRALLDRPPTRSGWLRRLSRLSAEVPVLLAGHRSRPLL